MIKGVDQLSKALADYEKETLQEVKEIVADNGSMLLNKAQRSLNAYTGRQLENLNFINLVLNSKDRGYTISVGVPNVGSSKKSHLAAYVEFGTGLSAKSILADYPEEVKQLAMDYFQTGKGTLKGSPYLFNNWIVQRDLFIKELNEYLNTRSK